MFSVSQFIALRKLELIEADKVSHKTLISCHCVAQLNRPRYGLMLDQNTNAQPLLKSISLK